MKQDDPTLSGIDTSKASSGMGYEVVEFGDGLDA